MIAAQILFIAGFLSITWGVYLIGTIALYIKVRQNPRRTPQEIIVSMRRVIVALCAWLFVFSFVFRTACVLIGVGDDVAGQLVFFTLVGTNVVGSLFAVVSLRYD